MKTDVVVVGGGAAGMMAAVTAARRSRAVTVIEHQKTCGRKLRITGKGRCNVTNDCDVPAFLKNVARNGKFLYSALSRFPPRAAMAFFVDLGVPLKVERGNRVFPVSDNAHDIANALEAEMRALGVKVFHARALAVETEGGAVCAVNTDAGRIACSAAVLATGGASYPRTGSDGGGYAMAKALGHTVIPPLPSLAPLESGDWYCRCLQGLSLKNVVLTAFDGADKKLFSELGELLFTHFGVSGPLALSASAFLRELPPGTCRLEIDLKPGLDEKKLDARLLRDFEKYRNRDLQNALDDLMPKSLVPILVSLSGIGGETKVHSVTKEQRKAFGRLLKHFPVSVSRLRPVEEAIVTAGGVAVGEIGPRTMESKRVQGLYFAGELIDVDAFTGGFNLHIAWSTGFAAGSNV